MQRTITKKTTRNITRVWQIVILSYVIFFNYSCKPSSDCSRYEINQQEKEFLSVFNAGDIAVFRNDTTGVFDTLYVTDKSYGNPSSSENCDHSVATNLGVGFIFSNYNDLNYCMVSVQHNSAPIISYPNFSSCCKFSLSGEIQSMTINNTTYNDVFTPMIDSITIPSAARHNVPWKIAYSKSNGFIRFYMVNGQTWSKL
jgi:hypothetical protein